MIPKVRQKKTASIRLLIIPSAVEGPRGINVGLFSGIPPLRFAPLEMTVKKFILNFQSTPARRAGFQKKFFPGHYGLRCIATHRFARIIGAADRENRY